MITSTLSIAAARRASRVSDRGLALSVSDRGLAVVVFDRGLAALGVAVDTERVTNFLASVGLRGGIDPRRCLTLPGVPPPKLKRSRASMLSTLGLLMLGGMDARRTDLRELGVEGFGVCFSCFLSTFRFDSAYLGDGIALIWASKGRIVGDETSSGIPRRFRNFFSMFSTSLSNASFLSPS